MHVNIAM